MGLGVLFRAPVPRRGWLKKPVELEKLWEEVATLGADATKRAGSPLTEWYSSHAAEERLWLSVVPFEEDIEFSVADGVVEVSAKTSGAGPGYHEFVVEFLDLLEKRVGLVWEPASGEDGDETGYRQQRDRQALRAEMARQLTGIASVVVERVGAGVMLNMSIDSLPSTRAFASSPMGEWSEEWLKQAASAEGESALALSEQFFPWWGSGVGPKELANFGRVLCWTAVRWVKPQTPSEEQAIRLALLCFERAREGGIRDLPDLEMAELKRLLAVDADADAPPRPNGIGFRRREFEMSLPGQWMLQIPGYYHEEVEDDATTQVFWFGKRTVRASVVSFEATKSPEAVLNDVTNGTGQALEGLAEGLVGAAETTRDESDDCYLTRVSLVSIGSVCWLTFAHAEEWDKEWALGVARTAKHRGSAG